MSEKRNTIVLDEGDEAKRGDLENLIDTVRRAAPNLEDGG